MDELDVNFEDLDLDALGKAARQAVDLYEADEPSDEALWEIENELDKERSIAIPDMVLFGEVPETISELSEESNSHDDFPNYEAMAVSQLKSELKRRGLRVTGKKNELMERLRQSEKNASK